MSQPRRSPPASAMGGQRELWVVAGVGVVLALLLRATLAAYPSGDFTQFTRDWYEAIGSLGVGEFLGRGITNYAPAYTYAMVVAHTLLGWLPAVVAIKVIGLPFDFACAYFVARLVGLVRRGWILPLLAFLTVLFLPTLVINGAMWGQADSIYTAGLLAFVYYIASGREIAACVALGLALCVKLQTLFLWPLLLILWLAGRLRWTSLCLVPGLYLLSLVPAWIAGRPLGELLSVYLSQATYYPRLTSNAPHPYQWFPATMYDMMVPAGICFSLGVCGVFAYAVARSRTVLTVPRLLQLASLSLLLVPFFTPKMHERYFFPADVMTVALAFVTPRLAWLPVAVGTISLLSYAPFLLRVVVVPLPLLALGMGGVIAAVLWVVGQEVASERASGGTS